MELKPGYKRAEEGVFPEDWEPVSLGSAGEWFSGGTPSLANDAYWSGDIPWVSPKDMKVSRLSDAIDHVTAKAVADGARVMPTGSILIVVRGMILAHSFPIAIAERPLTFNQDIKSVITSKRVDSGFLLYWLQEHSSFFRSLVTESTHGTKRLPTELLFRAQIDCPPKAEQEAIAESLSDADAFVESLEQLLAKKRHLKQGAMHELLTGKRRLPGFGSEWVTRQLSELGRTFGGLTGKSKADFGHGAARYLTFMNIMTNVVIDGAAFEAVDVQPSESQNEIQKGDLFFNGSSETPEEVGMCAVLTNSVLGVFLNSFCFGFRLREGAPADGLYLAYYFRSREGRELLKSLAQGAIRYNLSKTALLKTRFPLPPLDEQTAIAAVLSDMDTEIVALEAKHAKARAIKQGMMQELLTGRIRLV